MTIVYETIKSKTYLINIYIEIHTHTYTHIHFVHWYHNVTYNTIHTARTIISINQAPIINNASSGAILAPVDLSNKVTRTECEIKSPLFSLYYLIVYIRDKPARALFLSFSLSIDRLHRWSCMCNGP